MKLFVGNIPWSLREEELRELFAEHGQVEDVKIILDRETGRSRGFGFIQMPDEQGKVAIEKMNGHNVDGRALTVNEARPREPRSDRPRNFNNRGGGGQGRQRNW